MKVDEVFPEDYVECWECGKTFAGRINKQGKLVPAYRQLAGHIMASRDHIHKRWARQYLLDADVGAKLKMWNGWFNSRRGW